MNEPHDPRPLQTVNRLRLVVFIPVFVAVVGVLFLANKLSLRFRQIEEPPARDYPPSPPSVAGAQGRPMKPVGARWNDPSQTTPPTTKNPTAQVLTPSAGTGEPVEASPLNAVAIVPSPALRASGGAALLAKDLPPNGIVGRVFLRGAPPAEKVIPMDPSCGKLHAGKAQPTTRIYVVGTNGGLADVFVVLSDFRARRLEPPANTVEIRQRGCEYLPYISAALVGQTIRVFNDDPLMHNVHPTPTVEGNKEQNRMQINAAAPPLDHSFSKPELFLRFKCDVHPWMFAYISVVEHPFFAVSAADGQFALPEPPPGNYTVQFIHRKAGGRLVPVKVQAGKRLLVNVTLDIIDPDKSEATVTEE